MSETTGDDRRPLLLLIGSGGEAYRRWVLDLVCRRWRLWLLSERPAAWEADYLVGQTPVDALDLEAAIPAARGVAARMQVAGVLCYDEFRVWHAARLAEALGLPGSPPEALRACRDKRLSRDLMAAAGTPQARSVSIADLAGARRAAEEIGYPVILKPRALAGSAGVIRIDGPSELAASFAFARAASFAEVPRYEEGVLVEEYLDGPEITVDSAVWRGRVIPAFVSHKHLGMPPTFEETGHLVVASDPLLADAAIRSVVQSAHSALGLTEGVTHTELRLTRSGPRIVEVNARLGGGLIPYLGWLATGADLATAAADLACGQQPEVVATRRCAAAVRFLYPETDLVLDEVRVDRDALPHGTWDVRPLATRGSRLLLPPRSFVAGRAALGIVIGADERSCQRAFDLLPGAVAIAGRPLAGAGTTPITLPTRG